MFVWRCLPRSWNNYKLKSTVFVCVHTVVLDFTLLTKNFLFLYWLICFFCLLFWLMLTSSWVQEKLSPQQERQKDHQVHVRGEEEWNVRHGWRAHVRGSRPVPQAKGRQTQAGGASWWVKRNLSSQTLMSLLTSHTVAVRIPNLMKILTFNLIVT